MDKRQALFILIDIDNYCNSWCTMMKPYVRMIDEKQMTKIIHS